MDAGLLSRGPEWPDVPLEDLHDPGPDVDDAWIDPSRDPDVLALEALDRLARAEAMSFAQQVVRLAGLASRGRRDPHRADPEQFLALELAGTLRLGQGAALTRLDEAERLVDDLPLLLASLSLGVVFLAQARIVLYESRNASSLVSAELDRRLHALITVAAARDPDIVGWDGWTATRLRRKVRRLLLTIEGELEPEAVVEREEVARAGRRVSAHPEPDGMAALWALLPAEQARAFTLGLDELHRRQRVADLAAGIERTADQRRADLFALLPALALHAMDGTAPPVGPGGSCTHPAVVLHLHVPVATALGLSQEPGTLEGYGPISAYQVRSLLPSAALRLVLVDEVTGEPLYLDPDLHRPTPAPGSGSGAPGSGAQGSGAPPGAAPDTSPNPSPAATARQRVRDLVPDAPVLVVDEPEAEHDPSAWLARFVQLRDPLCTGPGCAMASTRSDLDHLDPWPAGPTSAENLGPKSRRCHRAKTRSWTVTRHPGGSHTWRSPTGRRYRVPPAWSPPPQLAPARPVQPRAYQDGYLRLPADRDLTRDLDAPLPGCGPALPPGAEPGLRPALDDVPPPF